MGKIFEETIIDDIVNELNEIEDIKDQLEKTELKMLKSKEIDWDEKQSLKNSLDQSKKEIENLEKIAEFSWYTVPTFRKK